MPLATEIVEALTARLDEAEQTRTQIGQFSPEYPEMTLDDSYSISCAWTARKLSTGRRVIGHKIGLTSRAMQRSSQTPASQ